MRIKKLNPSKMGIKRGGRGGGKEWCREERGHSRDPPAAPSYRDSRSWDSRDGEMGMRKWESWE